VKKRLGLVDDALRYDASLDGRREAAQRFDLVDDASLDGLRETA
jgi:hypothetical protein